MEKTRALMMTALCTALGLTLPMLFHAIPGGGGIFLPMHLPVLLCGLVCGPQYGFLCGLTAPLLSSALTGMPAAPVLPGMLCELAVYGLIAGLGMRRLTALPVLPRLYTSLGGAMLCGRVLSGLAKALIFSAGAFSFRAWVAASFITALPGIAVQLILLPALALALQRAKLLAFK